MSNDCPKCNTHNRAAATFCDSCGAELPGGGGQDPATPPSNAEEHRKVNYGGLLVVFIIVLGGWWFLFGPNTDPSDPPTISGGAGGGGTIQVENPHGGMGADDAGVMGSSNAQMMEKIELAKASLDQDPLDTDSLGMLYGTFAMVGYQDRVRHYLDTAVEALVAQAGDMDPALLSATLSEIAYAALYGNDLEAAEYAISTLGEAAPDNLGIMVVRGNIFFEMERRDEAIAAYTEYLDQADPEREGEAYWSARTDRATMFLQLGEQNDDLELKTKARDEFSAITKKEPDFFNAWFNLGLALMILEDEAAAEAAWVSALRLADAEDDKYHVAQKLAMLRGEDPPPTPAGMAPPAQGGGAANPHGGTDMGGSGSGMANPHGGGETGGDAESGMANPHGGGAPPDDDA